jgi:hypothetical protein
VGRERDGYSCLAIIDAIDLKTAMALAYRITYTFAPVTVLVIPSRNYKAFFVVGSNTSPGGLKPLDGVCQQFGLRLTGCKSRRN